MKNTKNGFIGIIIAILAALVIAGGAGYLYIQHQNKVATQNQIDFGTNTSTSTNITYQNSATTTVATSNLSTDVNTNINETVQASTSVAVSSNISNWQTYTGTDFSINYPSGWTLNGPNGEGDYDVTFKGKTMSDTFTPALIVSVYKSNSDYNGALLKRAALYKNDPSVEEDSTSTLIVDGVPAIKVEEVSKAYNAPWSNDDMYILLQKGSVQYQLRGSFEENDPTAQAIFTGFYNSFKLN